MDLPGEAEVCEVVREISVLLEVRPYNSLGSLPPSGEEIYLVHEGRQILPPGRHPIPKCKLAALHDVVDLLQESIGRIDIALLACPFLSARLHVQNEALDVWQFGAKLVYRILYPAKGIFREDTP